jgi:hypothetical protein
VGIPDQKKPLAMPGGFARRALVSAIFALGCEGNTLEDEGSSNDQSNGAPSESTNDPPPNMNTPVSPPEVVSETGSVVDCATLTRPPTPLRRLTQFEYNSTVQDLLATSLTPADSFPADEVVDGFTNNAVVLTISSLHAEKYMESAEELAAEASTRLSTLLPCDPATMGEQACAETFAATFGRRAYRRPLEPEDLGVLMEAYAFGSSFENGIELVLRTILQSPHFLFRVELTGGGRPASEMVRLNAFETATRLSYLIWSSAPDDALLDAAARGALETPEQVAEMARVMWADPRARRAATEFYAQWLELKRLDSTSKDPQAFPLWSEILRGAMKAEGHAFIQGILFDREGSLEELLTAPLGLPTGPLAELYGVAESSALTELSVNERAGILTLPAFLAVQAHPDQTAPVLRGKFVRRKLLCGNVPPPPDNVNLTAPEISEGATARERFSAHASESSCSGCHQLMDPLGFPFESYDALGAFRTNEGGRELDLTGEFVGTRGIDGPFANAQEMITILSTAEEVEDCVARQWFKFALGRTEESGDACSLVPLQESFKESSGSLVELLVGTTQTEAFLYRRGSGGDL